VLIILLNTKFHIYSSLFIKPNVNNSFTRPVFVLSV